jgi:hypothetical protein
MNPSSGAQIRQLLFAGIRNAKNKEELPLEKEFKVMT